MVDLHTGIGEPMKGDLYSAEVDASSLATARLKRWFGECALQFPNMKTSQSSSPGADGNVLSAITRWLPTVEVTSLAIEMGVAPLLEATIALVRENTLYHHGALRTAPDERLIDVFDPLHDAWDGAFYTRTRNVVEQMLAGLMES